MTKLILICFILFLTGNLLANNDKEISRDDNRYFAIEMSKCVGAQEANAELLQQMGQKSLAERTKGLSRGSKIVARSLFYQAGIPPEKLDDIIESYAYKTRLTVAADFEFSFPNNKVPNIAKKILDNCSVNWMPLQEVIVEQRRKEMYK